MQMIFNNSIPESRHLKKDSLTLLLMAVPLMLLVVAFCYMPLFGWSYAFFDYSPGLSLFDTQFTGFDSFLQLLTDPQVVPVLVNTLAMFFLGLLTSPLPVILAILLNEVGNKPFKRIFQTVSTLPYFISWVIVFALAFSMFSSDGVVNSVSALLHITDKPVNVLGNSDLTWYFQLFLQVWKGTGWGAIIYLAAIAGIDEELYDAAEVDGAGRFRRIIHITVPGIMPTFLVLLLLSISNILSVGFDQFLVFYNGLVADKITVLDLYVYRLGIVASDYPYSTAVGILKTIVCIILLFSVNSISKRIRGETLI